MNIDKNQFSQEERLQWSKTHRKEIIAEVESITFREYVDINPPIVRHGDKATLISQMPDEEDDVIHWIITVLTSEKIQGDYLLKFEDLQAKFHFPSPPWAKVTLGLDYKWVKPLWNLGHGIYILTLDERYFLQIIWDEPNFKAYVNKA